MTRHRRQLPGNEAPRLIAIGGLVILSLLGILATIASTAVDHRFWSWSTLTSLFSAVTSAAIAVVAYLGIPPNPKNIARSQIENAIALYPIIQDGGMAQRNAWLRLIRELVPEARYTPAEINKSLESRVEARRVAALITAQWHWPDIDGHMQLNSEDLEANEDRKAAEKQRSTEYFSAVCDLLMHPHRPFEHYHAIKCMWGMVMT